MPAKVVPEQDAPPGPPSKWLIEPTSNYMKKWDMSSIALLGYIMLLTPYEVAFLETTFNGLFIINRLIDVFFIVDLVQQFFLMYVDDNGRKVKIQSMIIKRYSKCWLWIDLISVLPFDTLSLILDDDAMKNFKALRTVRLFRLAKLLRILRVSRVFDRWESQYAVNYGYLSLAKFVFLTVIVAHWLACIWQITKAIEDTDPNWEVGYLGADHGLGHFEVYIVALYWSVMTMSTIGYGDVVAKTTMERVVATGGMFVGSAIFAYIIGAVTGTVASMGSRKTAFYELMDAVNAYLDEVQLPKMVRVRIREYFRHRFNTGTLHSNSQLLEMMSPALREQVATHTHAGWIRDIPYFNKCIDEFIVKVALALQHRTFAPHEIIVTLYEDTEMMYIVKAGVCACRGMIFTSGKVFGEDMITSIIKPTECKRYYTARALTFSDVYILQKSDLTGMMNMEKYKETYNQVRRLAVKTIFRECILSYSNAVKNLMSGIRRFTANRHLVEQFESKLARLLPTDADDEEEEEEEEESDSLSLGPESQVITAELRRMTDALKAMQQRVATLEREGLQPGPNPILARIGSLETQLQAAMGHSRK